MLVDDPLQHLSRAAGLGAYTLFWLDMCMGLAVAGRLNPTRLPRWRIGDLHQFTGLLSLGLLLTHIGVLLGVHQQPFTLPELVVPLARQFNPVAPLLGMSGMYVLLLVAVASHARRYFGLRLWRTIHALSFLGFGLSLAHALAAGPDATEPWVRCLYASTVAVLLGLTCVRVFGRGDVWRRMRSSHAIYGIKRDGNRISVDRN
jgi:methionine sulfoxide reductase heme-binding subunit